MDHPKPRRGNRRTFATWVWEENGYLNRKASVLVRLRPDLGISSLVMELYSVHAASRLSGGLGSAKIKIGAGEMMADRVVLPGSHVGDRFRLVLTRDEFYLDSPTCSDVPKVVIFLEGPKRRIQRVTLLPGKPSTGGKANYFIISYVGIRSIGVLTATLSVACWSIIGQVLKYTSIASRTPGIASPLIYGLIAVSFICVLNTQTVFAMVWVVLTKWLTIG